MLRFLKRQNPFALIVATILVFAAFPVDMIAQSDTTWSWRRGDDPDTVRRTRAELDTLLSLHAEWLGESTKGKRLSLHGAFLADANLADANLRGANFSSSDLWCADLSGVNLMGAYRSGPILFGFMRLRFTDLTQARFEGIDSLPPIPLAARAIGLRSLNYLSSPASLIQLREEFGKLGYRDQERQIICALRRHNANMWGKIFFDWTSEYGSNLARPRNIFFGLFSVCSLAYYIFMLKNRKSGVRVIIPIPYEHGNGVFQRHVVKYDASSITSTIYHGNDLIKGSLLGYRKVPMFIRLIWWAIFFGGISAFNIGFRDVNFGRWLKLLTRTEFDLQPFGWVRVVSGFQALSSVYLVALWILSFSGTPFK